MTQTIDVFTVRSEASLLDSGKFLQWMWFLEATFTPHLSELHHHKMVLPDSKKVPEVQYC